MKCKVCNQEDATEVGKDRHGSRHVCAICRRMYYPTAEEIALDDRAAARGLDVRRVILASFTD